MHNRLILVEDASDWEELVGDPPPSDVEFPCGVIALDTDDGWYLSVVTLEAAQMIVDAAEGLLN